MNYSLESVKHPEVFLRDLDRGDTFILKHGLASEVWMVTNFGCTKEFQYKYILDDEKLPNIFCLSIRDGYLRLYPSQTIVVLVKQVNEIKFERTLK